MSSAKGGVVVVGLWVGVFFCVVLRGGALPAKFSNLKRRGFSNLAGGCLVTSIIYFFWSHISRRET